MKFGLMIKEASVLAQSCVSLKPSNQKYKDWFQIFFNLAITHLM